LLGNRVTRKFGSIAPLLQLSGRSGCASRDHVAGPFPGDAGTPHPARVLAQEDLRRQLFDIGVAAMGNSPAEFSAAIRTEVFRSRRNTWESCPGLSRPSISPLQSRHKQDVDAPRRARA
jgi:hypothetical protein